MRSQGLYNRWNRLDRRRNLDLRLRLDRRGRSRLRPAKRGRDRQKGKITKQSLRWMRHILDRLLLRVKYQQMAYANRCGEVQQISRRAPHSGGGVREPRSMRKAGNASLFCVPPGGSEPTFLPN